MSETLINPNQIRDGIGGKIKILNVVQTGTLTRNGAIFSGFGRSNYLQLGARVDKGILSLDSSTYIKDFTNFYNADTIEINGSFICTAQATNSETQYMLAGLSHNNGIYGELKNNGTAVDFNLGICNGEVGIQSSFKTINYNTKYYFKAIISMSGTSCTFTTYLNTDGQTYDDTTKLSTNTVSNPIISGMTIGCLNWSPDCELRGSIDIADWSIKKNNEYWWKGVETL